MAVKTFCDSCKHEIPGQYDLSRFSYKLIPSAASDDEYTERGPYDICSGCKNKIELKIKDFLNPPQLAKPKIKYENDINF